MIAHEDIIEHLSQYEYAVRAEAGFAYAQLERIAPRALKSNQRLAKDYLTKCAAPLYQTADTFARLHALALTLSFIYEKQASEHPGLIRPHQFVPAQHTMPVIAESSPAPGVSRALNAALDDALCTLREQAAARQALILYLALARQSGVLDIKALQRLLENLPQAMVLVDAHRVLVQHDTQIFVLDAPATAFARQILNLPAGSFNTHDFPSALAAFVEEYQGSYRALNQLDTTRPNETLQALCFYDLPPAAFELARGVTPVQSPTLLRAMTGQSISTPQLKRRAGKRRQVNRDLKALQILACEHTDKGEAYDARTGSADESLLSDVRQALNKFASAEPRQSRASRSFKKLAHQLIHLLDKARIESSWFAYTIALYCTDLALAGTATKEKLRMSTITTYLSRLKSFARAVWSDTELIRACQTDMPARESLTALMNAQLSELEMSELVSVRQYLNYAEQTLQPPWLADKLETSAQAGARTRAHYVTAYDFHQACTHFVSSSHSETRQQFVIFVTLMYRLGLRYDEALSLQTDEVRPELGYVVISKRKLRKTQSAYRKVRLCFMTAAEQVALEKHLQRRMLVNEALLFDTLKLKVFERDFLQQLREQSGEPELVFHSLRHCAANNMLFQLALCCYPHLVHIRYRYFFLQDEAFSDAQLSVIKADLRQAGREPGPELSVLDMLSQQLGHSSPAITALSYLHLLHILCAELNLRFDRPLAVDALLALLPENNYQYEHKACYQELRSEPAQAAQYLFRAFTRGWQAGYRLTSLKRDPNHAQHLRFSAFLEQCQRFIHSHRTHTDDCHKLQRYLEQNGSPRLDFLQQVKDRHIPAWLRLLERLDTLAGNTRERNALRTFQKLHLSASTVNDFRKMRRCLLVYDRLGMQRLTLELHFNPQQEAQLRQLNKWRRRIEGEGHQVLLVHSPGAESLFMSLRPRYLQAPLWPHLPAILTAFDAYLRFIDQQDVL